MEELKINIPQGHISGIYKDTYIDKEMMEEPDLMDRICDEIDNAEIAYISIDNQMDITLTSTGRQGLMMEENPRTYDQYPLLLETGNEKEYVSICLLTREGSDHYVQLVLTVPQDNLINAENYDLPASDDGLRYIKCLVKSEQLYRDVVDLWGQRITVSDLQEPEEIKLFYNDGASAIAEKGSKEIAYFSNVDMEAFTRNVQEEAYKVYDSHSFGVTIAVTLPGNQEAKLYYADEGCAMFQLDGESYGLNPDGHAASIVRKYIEQLN